MNRKYLIIIFGFLVLVGFFLFFYSLKKSTSIGKVLGSSINTFYSEKVVKIVKPPEKKADATSITVNTERAVLIADNSKYRLFDKNADQQVPIASITKVMTAVASYDLYSPDDILTVTKDAVQVEGSKAFLKEGEQIKYKDLLYAMLLPSGNDAAKTIAEGKISETDFISLMNKKAKDLGMNGTHFMDVAGLDDNGKSTAYDIAILFSYALKNPDIVKIINTADYTISSVDMKESHNLKNSNRLVSSDSPLEGEVGGKTGFTPDAGHSLVSAATRNGTTLISVVLKTFSLAADASANENKRLLNWGFDSFTFST